MALLSATNYYNNAIVGDISVGSDIDIFEQGATPKFAVGSGFIRSDGSRFRYVQFGAAVGVGQAVATDISENRLISAANAVIAPGTAAAVSFEPVKAGAVGSHYIEATVTGSADQYSGGYLTIYGGTGQGYTYRVRGNTATNDPATSNLRLQLYEPLHEAVDETSDILIGGSPYADVEAASTGVDAVAIGVSPLNATSSNFGWVCTRGLITVRKEGGAWTTGLPLTLGAISGTLGVIPNMSTTPTRYSFECGTAVDDATAASTYAQALVRFE